jgi:dipeptidyl aminopeptidase/acylaminoacyl peptidase
MYFPKGATIGTLTWPMPRLDAIWLVGDDGTGLRQLSPTTLPAAYPKWSPDGARIVFESSSGEGHDIYTIRPDGSDVRRMTTDGASTSATWTPDGRILFVRTGGTSPGWWTMDSDGTDAALLISDAVVGAAANDFRPTAPTWQPVGGAAIVSPPWKALATKAPPGLRVAACRDALSRA